MKINMPKLNDLVQFSTLKIGDTFIFQKHLYMKIEDTIINGEKHSAMVINPDCIGKINSFVIMHSYAEVLPVDCEISANYR